MSIVAADLQQMSGSSCMVDKKNLLKGSLKTALNPPYAKKNSKKLEKLDRPAMCFFQFPNCAHFVHPAKQIAICTKRAILADRARIPCCKHKMLRISAAGSMINVQIYAVQKNNLANLNTQVECATFCQ